MDDKTKANGQYRKRINVHEDLELSAWSKEFAVRRNELKAAVKAVGPQAADVEKHLAAKKRAG